MHRVVCSLDLRRTCRKTEARICTNLLVVPMLDDLYWVMSYSRWKDERYWQAFRDALLCERPREYM